MKLSSHRPNLLRQNLSTNLGNSLETQWSVENENKKQNFLESNLKNENNGHLIEKMDRDQENEHRRIMIKNEDVRTMCTLSARSAHTNTQIDSGARGTCGNHGTGSASNASSSGAVHSKSL